MCEFLIQEGPASEMGAANLRAQRQQEEHDEMLQAMKGLGPLDFPIRGGWVAGVVYVTEEGLPGARAQHGKYIV